MKIILGNFWVHRDVRFFNNTTGALEPASGYTREETHGTFGYQDESLYCLYCVNDKIIVYLDGLSIEFSSVLKTVMHKENSTNHFQAYEGTGLIYEKAYPEKPETDGNPFWPSQPEDEDILLWIHNILNSSERQDVLLSVSRDRDSCDEHI